MCPDNQLHLVHFLEFLHCPPPEQPPCASRVLPPTIHIFLGVRPHQIAERSRGRYLHIPFEGPDGINGGPFGGEAAVDAEDLSLDDSGEGEIVKGIVEVVPDIMIAVFFGDFVIESVDVGNVARLVVAAEEHHHFGILELVEEEEEDRFHRIVAAVHVIPQEDISFRRNRPAFPEQLQQVPELAVHIPADGDWGLHGLDVGLLEQQGLDASAEEFDGLFRDHLAVEDGFDERVDVHAIIQV